MFGQHPRETPGKDVNELTDAKILIVDDDESGAAHLEACLKSLGYTVCAAVSSGRRALESAGAARPDLALVDLGLEGELTGPETGERIGSRFEVPVVYLTDEADGDLLRRARATGPFGYVLRPFEEGQLHLNIQAAVSGHERERRHGEARTRLKRNIDRLKDLAQLMNTVFDSMSEAVLAVSENGMPVVFNSNAQQMGGAYALKGAIDEWAELHGVFLPDGETVLPKHENPLLLAVKGRATDNIELFIRNKQNPDGIHVSVSGRPLIGKAGVLKGGVVVARDVTRLKQSEAELERTLARQQEQAQLMETVFDSMSEAVLAVSRNGMPVVFNSNAQQMVGAFELEGDIHKWADKYGVFQPDGETTVRKHGNPLRLAINGQATDNIELFIRNKQNPDGIHVNVSGRPLIGKTGVIKGGVVVARDVTKLKQAEAELERTLARQQEQAGLMQTVFSSISDGVVVADADGRFTLFNPSAEQIVGMGMLDLPPEQWTERYGVFYPDKTTHVPTERLPLVRAMRGEATDEIELFIRNEKRPDGVHISVSGRPLQADVDGHGGGVIVFRDVTRQKQADAELAETMSELRDQNELIDTAFKSISDGIVVANEKGEFLYVNPGAEQIVGMGATDGPQDEWAERYGTYHPDRETPMKTEDLPLIRAIHRGQSVDEEDMFIRNRNRPDGVYIRVSARPLLDKIGGIRGGVIIFRDVTERLLAEEALARAFAQGRLEIVETILHNIGNAINSVTTGIETVRRNLVNDPVGRRLRALAEAVRAHREDWLDYVANDPQGRKVMPFIVELAESLSSRNEALMKTVRRVRDRAHHIADIVRTQKALSGPGLVRKDVVLHDALSGAVRVLRDSLAKRGIQVAVDCDNAPREIRIQESQFHQMLVNLVKNALEAIDELAAAQGLEDAPRIRIRAGAGEEFLNLEVIDNGIGIRNKDTKVLFSPGYTTKESGSGLGLHSAANFVIALGGRIQPLSEGAGRGTTMRVTLPLSSVAPRATAGERPS